jgi:hypothetical protein
MLYFFQNSKISPIERFSNQEGGESILLTKLFISRGLLVRLEGKFF